MCRLPPEDARAAAARLFSHEVRDDVLHWLKSLGVPGRHRDDVAAQVWLCAWRSWKKFDPKRTRAERWLNVITVHMASHYHDRAHHRREKLTDDLMDVVDPAPDATILLTTGCIQSRVTDALRELAPELRFVLVSHDLEGIPMARLAKAAGLPLSTLYKRRARALAALRAVLESQEAEEDVPAHGERAALKDGTPP